MNKIIQYALPFIASASLLSACATNQTAGGMGSKEETARKIEVAKINTQLGLAYLDNKNIARAKQKLLLATQQAPQIPEPWYALGYFYQATGENEKAKAYYLKAVQLAPQRGDVQNNYGTYLCSTGQYAASIPHFIQAARDSNYLDVADAYENAGTCSLKMVETKRALYFFNMAFLQDPNRKDALLRIVEINYQLGNYQEAQKRIAQYRHLFSDSAEISKLEAQIKQHRQTDSAQRHDKLAYNINYKVIQLRA